MEDAYVDNDVRTDLVARHGNEGQYRDAGASGEIYKAR